MLIGRRPMQQDIYKLSTIQSRKESRKSQKPQASLDRPVQLRKRAGAKLSKSGPALSPSPECILT